MHINRQPGTTSPVRWLPGDSKLVELVCPVCHQRRRNTPLLEIPSRVDGSTLTLYCCSACDSKFFDPPGIRDFKDIPENEDIIWKCYVELTSGIWDMYWPAAFSSQKPAASLLDVGCGFGFTVDAWRRLHGEAIGVELARYGRLGAEQLQIPIYFDYLEDIADLQGKRFDVVYSCEVIEHVPDPQEFAALLSRYVADDGVLCLTTPNADFVRPENDNPTLLAALSPGYHGFLIGPAELGNILRACGYTQVLVRPAGERLFAWASQRPLSIDTKSPKVRAEYLRYLEEILTSRKQNDPVTDGIAYRHFRDTVLSHQFDAAKRSLARLETSLMEKYSNELFDPDKTLERVRALASANDYNVAYPWFLPNFYYLRGKYAKLVERNDPEARRYFRASRLIATFIESSWGFSFALEALAFLPEAWRMEAICAALERDPSVCEEWISAVAECRRQASPAFGNFRLSNHQLEQAYLDGLAILSSLNRPAALGRSLQDCLQYLENSYGNWLGVAPTATAGAPGGTLQHEHRMLLHQNIAVACAQLGVHTELVRPLLERVLKLGTMQRLPSVVARTIISGAQSRLVELDQIGLSARDDRKTT